MSGYLSSDLGLWKMLRLFLQIHTQTLTNVKMMQTLKNTRKIPQTSHKFGFIINFSFRRRSLVIDLQLQ